MATSPSEQAQAIRTTLESAADLINAQHAQVLSAVIAMKQANLHRTAFGYSALRDLLLSQFDFTYATAGSIAAIARLSTKFRTLAAAATSGRARIDQVAYAVRQLDKTPAMRLFARTPFREPVASPFDADTLCATPEHLIAEYCEHAPFKDLQRHLDELAAHLAEEDELLDGLGEQSLQWIELAEQGNGMWALSGELSWDTGLLLDKYLQTACPPPRQEEAESEPGEATGLLPAAPNRHAEALHQLLAGYGSSPEAAKRHGHTATLDLTVDIHALQGRHTGQADTSAEATARHRSRTRGPPARRSWKADRSASPRPACSPATPRSFPRSSTTRAAKRSNSAAPPASPTPHCAESSNSNNLKAAPGAVVRGRWPGPRRTTSCTGRTAVRRTPTT
ncbi:hypothetical protein GCM10009853_068150 [Glycomyces scopariae]